MQEYLTHSEAETEQAGADFARALPDGKVVAMPARDDIDLPVEEHLIVELYSK